MAQLCRRAIDLGLIGDGVVDVLWLFAAAMHALRVGDNPPALFAALIRRNMRLVISLEDEDTGRAVMRDWWRHD